VKSKQEVSSLPYRQEENTNSSTTTKTNIMVIFRSLFTETGSKTTTNTTRGTTGNGGELRCMTASSSSKGTDNKQHLHEKGHREDKIPLFLADRQQQQQQQHQS
jgi:hypothetical protein